MKTAEQSKNPLYYNWDKKNLKITVYFCLLVLVFNISLARAQEETLSASSVQGAPTGETSATIETPAVEAPTLEPAITAEPTATTELIIDNPLEPAQSSEAVTPEEPLNASLAENLTPPITTATEPIIFDFSQPAQTNTPESAGNALENNVAGAIEPSGDNDSILHEVTTGIIRSAIINQPAIIAAWQMLSDKEGDLYAGKDDSSDVQAQILPSGQYQVDKPIAVCAIIAGTSTISGAYTVSAAINYPPDIAVNSVCGQAKSQFSLNLVDKASVEQIICDKIKNNNNNLIAWASDDNGINFTYEQSCSQGGLLETGEAAVYCAETALAYDDPAGNYKVKVEINNNGASLSSLENSFKYLELTTFENDFSDILYGPVKLNEAKILKGDLDWGGSTLPTVRNTGNARLQIKIWQNDFGLGKTNGEWNLAYQAKVGTATDFISYPPEQTTALNNILELGQSANMDFAVLIKKFPEANSDSAFWGKMILSADKVTALSCGQ